MEIESLSAILKDYFLPYQQRWLADKSRIKIWEKSRRIGATYVQSFEDVCDCITNRVPAVYFTSADITSAKAYIQYCTKWIEVLKVLGQEAGADFIDDRNINILTITFKNGTSINAMTSNPKQLRGKGGKVVIDEFAFANQAQELWRSAKPCTTWGYDLRILSTHNGKNCLYYDFVEKCKNGVFKWGYHKTDINLAVSEGLVDKILKKTTTQAEKDDWIEQERISCGDSATFAQEYLCKPIDETTALFTYDLINKLVRKDILTELEELSEDSNLYCGIDIGRKNDITCIWILEKINATRITRKVIELKDMIFSEQEEIICNVLSDFRIRRCCIDSTGMGSQLAESIQNRFGKVRIETLHFTNKLKEDMAMRLLSIAQDINLFIPNENAIIEDFHSLERTITTHGNTRFNGSRKDGSHSDRFWACAMANYAITDSMIVPFLKTRQSQGIYYQRQRDLKQFGLDYDLSGF